MLRQLELPPRTAPTGTLVLLHGYGADERDLLPLAHEIDPGLRAISLQAPLSLGAGPRAWYTLEQTAEGFAFDPDEVLAAATLAGESIAAAGSGKERPWVLGFSQGAGIALIVALTRPELVRGVISFSGVPPRSLPDGLRASKEALQGLPVFAAHGLFDPLLPIELGRQVRALLDPSGVKLTWREYPMAHQVIGPELDDAREWLREARG